MRDSIECEKCHAYNFNQNINCRLCGHSFIDLNPIVSEKLIQKAKNKMKHDYTSCFIKANEYLNELDHTAQYGKGFKDCLEFFRRK